VLDALFIYPDHILCSMDISVHALIAVRTDILSVPYLDEFVHLTAMRTELRSRDEPVEDYDFNMNLF
jgi:hypothetical protein